jgi:hypothetical protein
VRRIFADTIATDTLDLATRRENGKIYYGFPVAVLAGEKSR